MDKGTVPYESYKNILDEWMNAREKILDLQLENLQLKVENAMLKAMVENDGAKRGYANWSQATQEFRQGLR